MRLLKWVHYPVMHALKTPCASISITLKYSGALPDQGQLPEPNSACLYRPATSRAQRFTCP
eukprot:1157297-Pelagomonas_calceolata.AAC.8